ncbi:MAG TPA: capsule assembly Wzi family protein [Rhizomicrobium sp.]|nr:capsule assembly Wzi family protein [Rhizomicrobium sp.]
MTAIPSRPLLRRLGWELIFLLVSASAAWSSPWAETGDNRLRTDVELLGTADVINGVTTHWPLPWTSIAHDLRNADTAGQSDAIQDAASRLLDQAERENRPGLSAAAVLAATNNPSVIYGFDGLGRGDGETALSVAYNSSDVAGRLSVGEFTQSFSGHDTKLMLDGSYVAAKLGDEALVYAGWLDHWWGPGWISALSLSNSARPMPQIGIQRLDTSASSWPVVNLLGPWQLEFFVGLLDGPRIERHTFYNALRLTFNPTPDLEIGLARTEEFCGQGHPCSPIRDYFHFANNPNSLDNTNDEAAWDLKYRHTLGRVPFQVYLQLMNEDYSWFNHSGTSHLFGVTAFLPVRENPLRLTLEFSDSIATLHPFSFGDNIYGFSYTNYQFLDGMRYRGRTLGLSLDDDSTLLSLQGSWSDSDGRFYELSFHHATIGNSHTPPGNNILSPVPVLLNLGEARISLPWQGWKFDLAARLQDDRPRPAHGFEASGELGVHLDF